MPGCRECELELYFRREATVDALPQLFENEVEAIAWLRVEQERRGVVLA